MLTPRKTSTKSLLVLDDCLAAVTEDDVLVTGVYNPTNQNLKLRSGTFVGTASPVTFSYEAVCPV